jgi:RNAse (barnase) inhibitor barstar
MAVWTDDDNDLDRRLVSDGFISKFYRSTVLDETVVWLLEHGYQVQIVDAQSWTTEDDMHTAMALALDFPAYYGRNVDALRDCLRDVSEAEYGWDRHETGLVLVLLNYDRYLERAPRVAHAVLDIFADAARDAALIGNRMLCLIGSNNPRLEIAPVGARTVGWNAREWRDADRIQ